MSASKNILICPLEWGLGHAARMIPLAGMLAARGCRVFAGAGPKHLSLYRSELPGVTLIDFPGFSPSYSRFLPQYFAMLLKTPALLYHIISEHQRVKSIIKKYQIDIIISDNRFGLWNNSVKSVYVTHMPRIPLPFPWKFLERAGIILHRWIISRYDYCIIPDLPGIINLTGHLSHNLKLPENVRYTGILSRFNSSFPPGRFTEKHFTVILSGPEPQRSILRNRLTEALRDSGTTTYILEGNPDKPTGAKQDGIFISISHLTSPDMAELLKSSECIFSRSGYTTIMDLVFLNCSGMLVPTPGQTEQEYLAKYLSEKGWFRTMRQKDITHGLDPQKPEPSWPKGIVEESKKLMDAFLAELLEE